MQISQIKGGRAFGCAILPKLLTINDLGRAGRRKPLTINELGDFLH